MAENNATWLDASYYQNIPNSEVNWAQLAQKWMQMRDAGEVPLPTSDDSIPPPPNNKEPAPQPPAPVNGSFLPPGGYLSAIPVDANYGGAPPCWIPPLPPNTYASPGAAFPPFMPPIPPWISAAPVPHNLFPPDTPYNHDVKRNVEEEEGGEYSHYYKEWDEKQKRSHRDNDSDDSESVPEGAMAHWLTPGPGWAPPPSWYRASHRDSSSSSQIPYIDHQTRKALPAWIREGLEKAEQERQKKQIKEAKLRAAEEAAKARRAAKGLGKFDSDSSDDENDADHTRGNDKLEGEPVFLQKRNQKKQQEEEFANVTIQEETQHDDRTDEEKREDALMLLRRFMTEVLLETTDNELDRIITEQIEFAKRSAQPKVLAQSSALAALTALGAESDDESSEESDTRQQEETASGASEEISKKPNTSADSSVFNVPHLPLLSSSAKSKAKLSSNDGFSSTESSQGVEKKETFMREKKNSDDESSRNAPSRDEGDDNAFAEVDDFSREKKLGFNNNSSSRETSKRDRKEKQIGESKKRQQKKSRSKGRSRKRSNSDKSDSETPEHYRRRSNSREFYHKRRRSRSRRNSKSRSRSRTRERRSRSRTRERRSRSRTRERRSRSRTRERRRFGDRRKSRSRSRSRERRRSRERLHREKHSRILRS